MVLDHDQAMHSQKQLCRKRSGQARLTIESSEKVHMYFHRLTSMDIANQK